MNQKQLEDAITTAATIAVGVIGLMLAALIVAGLGRAIVVVLR